MEINRRTDSLEVNITKRGVRYDGDPGYDYLVVSIFYLKNIYIRKSLYFLSCFINKAGEYFCKRFGFLAKLRTRFRSPSLSHLSASV